MSYPASPPVVEIDRVPVGREDFVATLARLEAWLVGSQARRVSTANLDFLRLAAGNDRLRRALRTADLVTADGFPLLWLARRLGKPIRERVAGSDLVLPLAGRAALRGVAIYLVGGTPETASGAAERLQRAHPTLSVAGVYTGPVDLDDDAACRTIARRVRDTGAGLVLLGLGCPKQELFAERYATAMGCRVVIGVGGTYDFLSGHAHRAPGWVQRLRLEWLFRLAQDPRRLAGRYVADGLYLLRMAADPRRICRRSRATPESVLS